MHSWDVAAATGQPSPINDDVAQALLLVAAEIVEPLRAFGAYAAARQPQSSDDATAHAALLRYLGRDPEHVAVPPSRLTR